MGRSPQLHLQPIMLPSSRLRSGDADPRKHESPSRDPWPVRCKATVRRGPADGRPPDRPAGGWPAVTWQARMHGRPRTMGRAPLGTRTSGRPPRAGARQRCGSYGALRVSTSSKRARRCPGDSDAVGRAGAWGSGKAFTCQCVFGSRACQTGGTLSNEPGRGFHATEPGAWPWHCMRCRPTAPPRMRDCSGLLIPGHVAFRVGSSGPVSIRVGSTGLPNTTPSADPTEI